MNTTNDNQIVGSDYRFTILSDRLIRMEYQVDGHFEDRLTQTVQNRDFKCPDYTMIYDEQGFLIQIETDFFHLYYRGGEFNGETLFIDSKYNYGTHYNRWHYGDVDEKNLLGTARTLDKADGEIPLEMGVLSKSGFSILDDSKSMIQDHSTIVNRENTEIDLYGFAFGHRYLDALKTYYQLTGFPPIIPRFALGNWWSRFYPYTQDSYLQLMARFEQARIPLSISVLDMNWHTTDIPKEYGSGWTGYTWNKKYFNDPEKMLAELHRQGKRVTLNVHPAAGIRPSEAVYPEVAKAVGIDPRSKQPVIFDLNNPKFVKAYMETIHHALEKQGVDFWWVDWQQGSARSQHQVDPLWLLNVLHYNDQKARKGNDALTLSRYAGPGSHRYPIGFSGDSIASWKTLQFQPYFTATASNIGYTWWSHDIGGHMHGKYDPELALRWLQFGVFSPIMRLHSSDNQFMGKEPWNYDSETEQIMTNFMQLRHKLVPYIENANIETHEQGIPLMQPLYYQYPEDKPAYQYQNEYFFGSQLLVIPITTPKDSVIQEGRVDGYIPAGQWTDLLTHQTYVGPDELTLNRPDSEYPVLVKSGGVVVLNEDYMENINQLPVALTVQLFAGDDNQYSFKEQLGDNQATTTFRWSSVKHQLTIEINDPAGIIPPNRQLDLVEITSGQTVVVSGVQETNTTFVTPIQVDGEQLSSQLIYQKLVKCRLDFDLKQKIYQVVQNTTNLNQVILTLQSMAPQVVSEMLSEVLLSK